MLKNLLNGKGFNRVAKTRHGYMVYNKNDEYVGKSIEMYGEYSEGEVDVFRAVVAPGSHVMDIGANIGALTLPLARIVGNIGFVYAFEPQQVVFQALCANMALNSIENVQCLPYAVSDRTGYTTLTHFDYNIEGNYGGVEIEQAEAKKDPDGYEVRKVMLDSCFKDIKRLDFVKIDVEGMEEDVLNGARGIIKKFRPILYVENDREDKSESLMIKLDSFGYRLFWHTPMLFNPNNLANEKRDLWPDIASFNLLCIPKEREFTVNGPAQITDFSYHPLFHR